MMTVKWIEIGNGKYKKINEETIVDIEELYDELDQIEDKIQDIKMQFKPIPENAEEWVVEAINLYNQTVFGPQLAELEIRKKEIEQILQEINNGD